MKTRPIGVRFDAKTARLLIRVCQLRGEDVSDFVRRAVLKELAQLSYLGEDEKKALGISASGEVWSGEARSDEVMSGKVWSGPVGRGPVR